MAYNNGFPVGYPYYTNIAQSVPQNMAQWANGVNQQQYPIMQNATQNVRVGGMNNMIIDWVQGVAAARSYNVQPGCSAVLMDSELDKFYIKAVDASGIPLPLRAFNYSEGEVEPAQEVQVPEPDLSGYVTKDEISDLISSEIQKAFSSMGEKSVASKTTSKSTSKKVK